MKKILVIQTASIGDVILASALLESVHTAMPGARLDLLVKKGNETLFMDHPYLNSILVWDKKNGKYLNFIKILRQVRYTKYDLVINIQRFFMTGLLTILSRAAETRGFSKNPLSWLFTKKFKHIVSDGFHEVMRNNSLVADLGIQGAPRPKLYPSSSDEAAVRAFATGTFYTISPVSLWFTKQYPVGKWIELIRTIPENASIYLLGSPADKQICEDIISLSGHPAIKSLAGELTLLQSSALMKYAKMNFTNDSAPMHLASAVNAPVAAIYCSTVPGFGFGPLSDHATVIEVTDPLYCRPCGLHGLNACPEKHFKCASNIEVAKLTRLL